MLNKYLAKGKLRLNIKDVSWMASQQSDKKSHIIIHNCKTLTRNNKQHNFSNDTIPINIWQMRLHQY